MKQEYIEVSWKESGEPRDQKNLHHPDSQLCWIKQEYLEESKKGEWGNWRSEEEFTPSRYQLC